MSPGVEQTTNLQIKSTRPQAVLGLLPDSDDLLDSPQGRHGILVGEYVNFHKGK